MTPSLREAYKQHSQLGLNVDYSALELRILKLYNIDPPNPYGMKHIPYNVGDYVRTKDGSKDLRIRTEGHRWKKTKTDPMRLQIRVRTPGSRKSHWSWADRWVKASPLEALAAQAAEENL